MANNTQLTDSHGNPITPIVPMPSMTASNVSTTGGSNVQADLNNINQRINNLDPSAASTSSFNPFSVKPLYHHLNQEPEAQLIPAQSLIDLWYAKTLGFEWIEVNVQQCSDGVYVCKHGLNGAIGRDVIVDGTVVASSTTKFEDVTSTWLRQHVLNNSVKEKFKVPIPTLDEVCSYAKELGLGIKIGNGGNDTVLAILRKYLPDSKIFLSGRATRGIFTGMIEYVYYNTQTVDACIQACINIGAPCVIVIASGQFGSASDALVTELCTKAHNNGFLTSIVYPSGDDTIRALSLGVDAICSNGDINPMEVGLDINVTKLSDERIVLADGATYDSTTDTITMPVGSKATISADSGYNAGAISLSVRYSGELTFGKLTEYASDGVKPVEHHFTFEYHNAASQRLRVVEFVATANSVIKNISLKYTKIC